MRVATVIVLTGLLLELTSLVASAAERPVAVGVALREFRLTPYRETVQVGPVKFNLHNFGEDGHNFVIVSPRGKLVAKTVEIKPGDNLTVVTKLTQTGTYRLQCTLGDHAKRGMRSSISVRKK